MKALTWDIGIVAALALLLAYSILIRRHKSLATLVSVYIAYFIATAWGERVPQFFSGDRVLFNQVWIRANAQPHIVEAFLLLLFTFVVSAFLKLGGRRSRYSIVEIVSYSICTIAVALMFILLFMPDAVRETVFTTSKIAPFIYRFRDWVMILPVFAMIYFGIYGDDDV